MPSPQEVGGTWGHGSWPFAVRQGGFSPLRPGLYMAQAEVIEFLPDGGLSIGGIVERMVYGGLRFSRVGPRDFAIEGDGHRGTWHWLDHERAMVVFPGSLGEYVKLRPGEDIDGLRNEYWRRMTQKRWAEVVGVYTAPDGGVLRMEADGGVAFAGYHFSGRLLECRRECRADAGVRLCFESDFTGLGDVTDYPLSLLFEVGADGGWYAYRSAWFFRTCDVAAASSEWLESYLRH